MPRYHLADLLRVCFHATPYARPTRALGYQLAPKWFAPRELPPHSYGEPHVHHLYEAVICLQGQARFTMAHTQEIGPGTAAMHPPNVEHTEHSGSSGGLFLWMGFAVEPAVHVVEPVRWPVWPALLADMDIMVEESRLNLRGWAERAGARLTLMLARVLTLAEPQQEPHPVPMNYQALAHEVGRYCEMYFGQPIRLDDLADYFQTSPRTLQRHYQRLTGETVMQHLQTVRLEKAAWLLTHSALPIREIAAQCALEVNYFSRVFHTRYGVTPTQYRLHGDTELS
jgi:AraC-like DNA-binding protein